MCLLPTYNSKNIFTFWIPDSPCYDFLMPIHYDQIVSDRPPRAEGMWVVRVRCLCTQKLANPVPSSDTGSSLSLSVSPLLQFEHSLQSDELGLNNETLHFLIAIAGRILQLYLHGPAVSLWSTGEYYLPIGQLILIPHSHWLLVWRLSFAPRDWGCNLTWGSSWSAIEVLSKRTSVTVCK